MDEEHRFYTDLYSSKIGQQTTRNEDIVDYLTDLEHPTLDEDAQKKLGKEITEHEIWEAICQSQDNKSPGNDGFTIEFSSGAESWEMRLSRCVSSSVVTSSPFAKT